MQKDFIRYGNLNGRYFNQSKIDSLTKFVNIFVFGKEEFGDKKLIDIDKVEIWYDQQNDFNFLSFICNTKKVLIRYYKVYSVFIDEKPEFTGVHQFDFFVLIYNLRKRLVA
jgi:hypothetical protein